MNKQREKFSFNPPTNLAEEGKWLSAVSSFECTNSVFNISDENDSFSFVIARHWESKPDEKTIEELNGLLELRSLDLHVKQVRKRGIKIKKGNIEYKKSNFDTQKNEILERLKNIKYNDFEDLV